MLLPRDLYRGGTKAGPKRAAAIEPIEGIDLPSLQCELDKSFPVLEFQSVGSRMCVKGLDGAPHDDHHRVARALFREDVFTALPCHGAHATCHDVIPEEGRLEQSWWKRSERVVHLESRVRSGRPDRSGIGEKKWSHFRCHQSTLLYSIGRKNVSLTPGLAARTYNFKSNWQQNIEQKPKRAQTKVNVNNRQRVGQVVSTRKSVRVWNFDIRDSELNNQDFSGSASTVWASSRQVVSKPEK